MPTGETRGDGRVVVRTESGPVSGYRSGEVLVFRGIPYARITTRFAPSTPASWSTVHDARQFGPSCPQAHPGAVGAPAHLAWALDTQPRGEHCLVLNVFTPTVEPESRCPVMVYLHGGAFFQGSASAEGLDGSNLADHGVVVVTLNHRLGIFGHLLLAEGDAEVAEAANVGMLDIVDALTWIQANIEAFGGDRSRVTIFGQSGGGSKVAALMTMPAAAGLFHRAVIQSSSSGLRLATVEEAERTTSSLLRTAGLSASENRGVGLRKLRTLAAPNLVSLAEASIAAAGGIDNFRPVVDGCTVVGQPFGPESADLRSGVPLVVGWCETECRLALPQQPEMLALSARKAISAIRQELRVPVDQADALMRIYAGAYPADAAGDLATQVSSDHRYLRTATRIAELSQDVRGDVYLYRLSWQSPVLGGILRSPHTLCLPFVFRNVHRAVCITGEGAAQRRLEHQMSSAWLAVARTGSPNHPDLPRWEPFTVARRATMIFDDDCHVADDPRRALREAWLDVPEYLPARTEGRRTQ
jgi:para-nitrobenzyl esterase